MGIVGALIILNIMELALGAFQRDYVKVLKIEFNQTGTRCKDPYCRLRSISRYDTVINAGCDLQRPINSGFMNVKILVKTDGSLNFRQIIDVKNLEPCKIMADRKWFPPVNYLFDRSKQLYPKLVHDCPYTEFKMENFTLYFLNNLTEEDKKRIFFPNGIYRIHVKVWDNGDEGHVTIWAETKFKNRTLTPPSLLWN